MRCWCAKKLVHKGRKIGEKKILQSSCSFKKIKENLFFLSS